MGNRAVITTKQAFDNNGIGVYLHWNGGRDSVEAFLMYCKLRGFRSPSSDSIYGWARFCQVVGNYFGGGLSLGIGNVNALDCDNWDNGVYIIDGWDIVGRECIDDGFVEQNTYDLLEFVQYIDECQPEKDRLGKQLIEALLYDEQHPTTYEEKVSTLGVGSLVAVRDWNDAFETVEIVGFGENGKAVNGYDVSGIPFFNKYSSDSVKAEDNINNYLTSNSRFIIINEAEPQAESESSGDEQMTLI